MHPDHNAKATEQMIGFRNQGSSRPHCAKAVARSDGWVRLTDASHRSDPPRFFGRLRNPVDRGPGLEGLAQVRVMLKV